MPGMIGKFTSHQADSEGVDLTGALVAGAPSRTEQIRLEDGLLMVSYFEQAPLKGRRCFENDSYAVGFAGDLIGPEKVPWDDLLNAFTTGDHARLDALRGNFAIVAFDKKVRRVLIASDLRGQQPIYYRELGRGILISTEMGTFLRLGDAPKFDVEWLYQYIFVNFPLGATTFLEGVRRLAPASVLTYDLDTGKTSISRYAEPYRRRDVLLKGREALDLALSVFAERVPKYFGREGDKVCVSLTGGWDSRVVLSFCPPERTAAIQTYTYGVDGCDDLKEADAIAAALGLHHRRIIFGDSFVSQLPTLMTEAVYRSCGAQTVLRAPVLYALKALSNGGVSPPTIISGIAGDTLFRGHCHVPAIISHAMDRVFTGGKPVIDEAFFRPIFADGYHDFASSIMEVLKWLEQMYGRLDSRECHLSYMVYEVHPQYFLGETAMANQYAIHRVPCWDDDIVKLAHETEYSTLTFSRFAPAHTDSRQENMLHTHLLTANPDFKELPLAGIPTYAYGKGKIGFNLYRLLYRLPRKALLLDRKPKVPISDWKSWMDSGARGIIEDLVFSEKSLVRAYLNPDFIKTLGDADRPQWTGRIATVELMLRMLANSWKM